MLSTQSRKRILALAFAMLALPVLVATPLGCSLFGIQAEENPAYQTSFEQDDFEVRNYEPVLVAQTIVPGDYRAAGDAAFKRLADYIFGKNTTSEKMDMTAPVIQKEQGEKMEMTAPVLQRPEGEGWLMQFVMPSKYTLETLPKPLDPQIEIKTLPARKVAVLVYRGRLTEKNINAAQAELMQWVSNHNLKPLTDPVSAAYDPPWTIPLFRHNEAWVEIE